MRITCNNSKSERGRVETPAAVEAAAPIRGPHALHAHFRAAARSMKEFPVAEVDADVRKGPVARVVEHEVAGRELLQPDRLAYPFLPLGRARDHNTPGLCEYMRHEAAAIEAGFG